MKEELDAKLFTRTNREVTLTDEGKVLLEYANHILLLMDEAKSKVNPSKWRVVSALYWQRLHIVEKKYKWFNVKSCLKQFKLIL